MEDHCVHEYGAEWQERLPARALFKKGGDYERETLAAAL
jgi:hypothetical protein